MNQIHKNHLIDDSGVYSNVKTIQTRVFVAFCRIASIAMTILGIVALYVGLK